MTSVSPFPVKLRKTKVDGEKKSAGKFDVKLKVRKTERDSQTDFSPRIVLKA